MKTIEVAMYNSCDGKFMKEVEVEFDIDEFFCITEDQNELMHYTLTHKPSGYSVCKAFCDFSSKERVFGRFIELSKYLRSIKEINWLTFSQDKVEYLSSELRSEIKRTRHYIMHNCEDSNLYELEKEKPQEVEAVEEKSIYDFSLKTFEHFYSQNF